MDTRLYLLVGIVVYPTAAALTFRLLRGVLRDRVFAVLNLAGAYFICELDPAGAAMPALRFGAREIVFLLYVAGVSGSFGVLRWALRRGRGFSVAPVLAPLARLLAVRFLPPSLGAGLFHSPAANPAPLVALFVGSSYLAFRLSHLAVEVQNGIVPPPSLANYLSFAFFVPTLVVGPISPYSLFSRSIGGLRSHVVSPAACAGRVALGVFKCIVLASMLNQFTYDGLLRDGHAHGSLDLAIAVVAFALYLYCNFSGYCDIAIGTSAFLGIDVLENFDRPFTAVNFQEFWSRWHISLSSWFRDMVFTPTVKVLVRRLGARGLKFATSVAILLVFLLIGIWHGNGLHFVLFGLSQGVGVLTVFLWSSFLRSRLGAARYAKVRGNPLIRLAGQCATFGYFSVTLVLFANTVGQVAGLLRSLR